MEEERTEEAETGKSDDDWRPLPVQSHKCCQVNKGRKLQEEINSSD